MESALNVILNCDSAQYETILYKKTNNRTTSFVNSYTQTVQIKVKLQRLD